MNLDIQTLIVGLIILVAMVYAGKMIYVKIRSFSPKGSNCGSDCGCDSKSNKTLAKIQRN